MIASPARFAPSLFSIFCIRTFAKAIPIAEFRFVHKPCVEEHGRTRSACTFALFGALFGAIFIALCLPHRRKREELERECV